MWSFHRLRLAAIWCILLLCLSGCGSSVDVVGLRPVYPEADEDYVEVDSRQPTLRWEAFPNADFIEVMANGIENRITDVTYELRIWRVVDDFPSALVYERSRLIETHHRIEEALDFATEYQWTVRARFDLDRMTRVIRWGMIAENCSVRKSQVPSLCYYRFTTPAAQQ